MQTNIPKVFGVLSIIFASIVLLFGLMGMIGLAATSFATQAMGSAAQGSAKTAEVADMMGALKTVYGGIGGIGVILSVMSGLLLAIGIGQLRYREWARRYSVYWGAAALVCIGAMVAICLTMIGPGYRSMFESMPVRHGAAAPDLGPMASIFGGAYAMMLVFFYAPYPILMLIFFTRERVRSAMLS